MNPASHSIVITIKGRTYSGTYSVSQGIMIVSSDTGADKAAQVGQTPPDVLAKIVLAEIINGTV